MKYIDIHAHLNFKDYDSDRDEVISRLKKNNLGVINIGTCLKTSMEVVEMAYKNENMWATIGLHPIYTPKEPEFLFDKFQKMIDFDRTSKEPKIVGVGECGLDYFHVVESDLVGDKEQQKKIQKKVFKDQIEFAIANNLPIMIHCRDAYDDVLQILENKKNKLSKTSEKNKLRGNIHFYAGSIEQMKRFLELDFTISFTGVATFANQYRPLIEMVPIDKIHAETDSPYVAPVPYRGQRNEPNYVIEVVKKISEIKKIPIEEVEAQLIKNAQKTFKLI